MPNKWGDGGDKADTNGQVLLAQLLAQGLSDQDIANTLRLNRSRLAPKIQAVRDDLAEVGVKVAKIPAERGPWGHRRG